MYYFHTMFNALCRKSIRQWALLLGTCSAVAVAGTAPVAQDTQAKVPLSIEREAEQEAIKPIDKASVLTRLAQRPLRFEENRGQAHDSVKYFTRTSAYQLFLTEQGATWRLPIKQAKTDESNATRYRTIALHLLGGKANPTVSASERLPGISNYLKGKESEWVKGVPSFAKVHYHEVYPNIDMVYYSRDGQLEYDFVVKPGSTPDTIHMQFSGVEDVALNEDGTLSLDLSGTQLTWSKPIIYQVIDEKRVPVAGRYTLDDKDRIGFQLAAYDKAHAVIIDPILLLKSVYVGGSDGGTQPLHMTQDDDHVYITGFTAASDLPGNVNTANNVFVTKLKKRDLTMITSAYVGGSDGSTSVTGIIEDADHVYIVGRTLASDFSGSVNSNPGSFFDAFVAKLDKIDLSNIKSAYIGGATNSTTGATITQSDYHVYIAGQTRASDLVGAKNASPGLGPHAFVARLYKSNLGKYIKSAYVGGTIAANTIGFTNAQFMTRDDRHVYITGQTTVPDLTGAQNSQQGAQDIYVAKLEKSDLSDIASVYIGGLTGLTFVAGIIQENSHVYIAGSTHASDLTGALNSDLNGTGANNSDAYVTRLDKSDLGNHIKSVYIGGANGVPPATSGNAVIQDDHHIYVTGQTRAIDLVGVLNSAPGSSTNAFVAKLNKTNLLAIKSAYVGGNANTTGLDITQDDSHLFIAGWSYASDLMGALNTDPSGFNTQDIFVARFEKANLARISSAYIGGSDGSTRGQISMVRDNHDLYIIGDTNVTDLFGALNTDPRPIGGVFTAGLVAKVAFFNAFNELIKEVKYSRIDKYLKEKLVNYLLKARCMLNEGCIYDSSQEWVDNNPSEAHESGCENLHRFIYKVKRYVDGHKRYRWIREARELEKIHECDDNVRL